MAESFEDDTFSEFNSFRTSKEPLKVILLHGNMDIWVKEAKNLPNMDNIGSMFKSKKREGKSKASKNTSDPYVTVSVSNATIARTYVIADSENPVWMQHFYVPVAHYAAEVHFLVKDSDVVGSEIIGVVGIPVDQIFWGKKFEGTFPVLNANGKPYKRGSTLTISIQYTSIDKIPLFHCGVGSDSDCQGVPGTYFPLRRGGRVTLYQDAHVPDSLLPIVELDDDKQFVHGKCWHDIFAAIKNSRRLIYITGWSVVHKVRLVRDDDSIPNSMLGELLKIKSQEGVRVLLLVWDDPTSTSFMGVKRVRIEDLMLHLVFWSRTNMVCINFFHVPISKLKCAVFLMFLSHVGWNHGY